MPLDLRTRPRVLVARVRSVNWRLLLVAAFVAVLLGLAGGSLGQWLGWRTAGALPTDAEAEAIARLAVGGAVPAPERQDEFFGYDPDGVYGPGYVRFVLPADPAAASFRWQAKDVRIRLDTAGWSVDKTWAGNGPDQKSDPSKASSSDRAERVDGLMFVADKGEWRVRYSAGPGEEARLEIVRLAPIAVTAGGALGGLGFAGLGWLLGLRATRRFAHLGGLAKRATRWLVLASAAGMLPLLLLTLVRLITGHAQLSSPQVPLWTAFTGPVLQPLGVAAVILLGAAAAVLVGARLPESAPSPEAAPEKSETEEPAPEPEPAPANES